MKTTLISLLLMVLSTGYAQEIPLDSILVVDMLEFNWLIRARQVQEKLWQLEYEVEIDEGITEGQRKYYIELQDPSILDFEVEHRFLWFKWYSRFFNKRVKKKLIKFQYEP